MTELIEEEFEVAIKVVIVGNGRVGKTSMMARFCKGTYTDQYKKTLGVDFLEKQQYVPAVGESVKLLLWDTAGQEEFDAITKSYYQGAKAAVLAFSTTDRDSFEAIERWKKKVENECGSIIMALVQNKVDLIDQAKMTQEEAEGLAKKLGVKFFRTSVKDNLNVEEVFDYLATAYMTSQKTAAPATPNTKQASVGSGPSSPSLARAQQQPQAITITSGPSKKRTDGKKPWFTKCSLV